MLFNIAMTIFIVVSGFSLFYYWFVIIKRSFKESRFLDNFYKSRNGVFVRILRTYIDSGSLPKPLIKIPEDTGVFGMMLDFGIICFLYFLLLFIIIMFRVFPLVIPALAIIVFLIYRKVQTA